MPTGTVRWFDQTKGYGLIRPHAGGRSVFVDISAVKKAGLKTLNDDQTVDYEVVIDACLRLCHVSSGR
jgi:CspA family cold shock protein